MVEISNFDLERASRDQLIGHICNLESELSAWRGDDDERAKLRLSAMFALTGKEASLVYALKSGRVLTKDALLSIIYAGRADDAPLVKIIDVFISKVRRKLAPYGIAIDTLWSVGYQLTGDNLDKIIAVADDGIKLQLSNDIPIKPISHREGEPVYRGAMTRSITALLALCDRADPKNNEVTVTASAFAKSVHITSSFSSLARVLEKKGHLEVISAPPPGGGESRVPLAWHIRITEQGLKVASVWRAQS